MMNIFLKYFLAIDISSSESSVQIHSSPVLIALFVFLALQSSSCILDSNPLSEVWLAKVPDPLLPDCFLCCVQKPFSFMKLHLLSPILGKMGFYSENLVTIFIFIP